MANTTGYLYTPSYVSVATLQGDASAVVENWTALLGETWNVQETSLVILYTSKRIKLNNRYSAQGHIQLPSWKFLLSFSQADYALSNKFDNRLDTEATVQTFSAPQDAWKQYQAIATPTYEAFKTVNNYWMVDFTIDFSRVVLIT